MSHPKAVLERLGGMLAAIEDGLLVLLLAAMIGLAGTQILLRNVLDTGLGWGDPLLRVTVMWIGLLGAMAASRDDNHITIDLVSRILKGRAAAVTSPFRYGSTAGGQPVNSIFSPGGAS